MDKSNIQILLLKDQDITAVNEFHNSIYKDGRDASKFAWEFLKAPAGAAIYIIAKDVTSQKVVGTQCAIPIELVTGTGTKILTAKSEDTLVHPEYRGLNIFENMYNLLFEECRKAGIHYIWGFTSARKPFIKLGFETPYSHSQSLLAINIMTSYKYIAGLNPKNSFLSRLKISGLCTFSKFNSFTRIFLTGNALKGIHVSGEEKSLPDNTQLISSILGKYPGGFMIGQDAGYVNWRFTENPYPEKLFNLHFSDPSEVVANVVFNHHKNGVWYLIQDLYSEKLNEDQKAAVFSKAVNLLLSSGNNVKLIRTWDFTHHEYNKQELTFRKRAGFTHLDRGILFVWKSLSDTYHLKPENFILSRVASQGVI
jgi:hypothetical protein